MITNLYLTIQESDGKHLIISDKSYYNPDITIENPILQITTPGMKYPVNFDFEPNKTLVLNSSLLNIAKVKKHSDLPDLPDGIYIIKYSICPNNTLYTEFYHYHINKLKTKFYSRLCKYLTSCACNEKEMEELKEIRVKLIALENMAMCLDIRMANETYKNIENQLGNLKDCKC